MDTLDETKGASILISCQSHYSIPSVGAFVSLNLFRCRFSSPRQYCSILALFASARKNMHSFLLNFLSLSFISHFVSSTQAAPRKVKNLPWSSCNRQRTNESKTNEMKSILFSLLAANPTIQWKKSGISVLTYHRHNNIEPRDTVEWCKTIIQDSLAQTSFSLLLMLLFVGIFVVVSWVWW